MNTIDRSNYHFSPSINIVRDNGRDIDYILTPNAKLVYSQLVNGFQIGVRSYNLVGAYGTGKSAFLKALENDITDHSNNFQNKTSPLYKLNRDKYRVKLFSQSLFKFRFRCTINCFFKLSQLFYTHT